MHIIILIGLPTYVFYILHIQTPLSTFSQLKARFICKTVRRTIIFQNENGNKVRDTNIEKTFAGLEVNKEALTHEFERQNEIRLAKDGAIRGRDNTTALIRESQNAIDDNRSHNRAVIDAEDKSRALAEQRRAEERQRALDQERAREARRRAHQHSGTSL